MRARQLGWPVLPSYGLTEAASQVATAPIEVLEKPYSSGPLPVLPHWQVACDEEGRISIRGRSLFAAEVRESDQGVEFIDRGDGWYPTGDRGRLGEAGLELSGRVDFVVKVLGELIDPVAVERKIGLRNAAVVAVPDARRQHRLVLVVEGEAPEAAGAVSDHNASAKGPERVDGPVSIPKFPRSELGKVRRAELSSEVARQLR
jgi:O-succinylbenzoic acid--CoA ligase